MKTITLWSMLGLALLSFQLIHANEDQVIKPQILNVIIFNENCQTWICRLMAKILKFIRLGSNLALGDVWISSPRWRNSSTRTLKRISNAQLSGRSPVKVQSSSFSTPTAKNWKELTYPGWHVKSWTNWSWPRVFLANHRTTKSSSSIQWPCSSKTVDVWRSYLKLNQNMIGCFLIND